MKLALALIVALPAIAAVPDRGQFLFEHSWTPFDPEAHGGDGVGPTYNASSCVECHAQHGPGGAGAQNVTSRSGRVVHTHGMDVNVLGSRALDFAGARELVNGSHATSVTVLSARLCGTCSHDFARIEHDAESMRPSFHACFERAANTRVVDVPLRVRVAFRVANSRAKDVETDADTALSMPDLDDCLSAAIAARHFEFWSDDPVAFEAVHVVDSRSPPPRRRFVSERNTPALFGDGLIESIPDDVIESATTSSARYPEIHGVVGRTREGAVARFGWKGDTPDLFTFVSRACANEVGLDVPGQPQPGKRSPAYDLSLDDVVALTEFVRSLPRPIEAERAPFASEGAELFDSIGCTACHRAALGDVDGIYSDLLLHDMGLALDDDSNGGSYGGPQASTVTSRMWRTPPLWGVRDSGPWLHDGRAHTLVDAVRAHGGEAQRVRRNFEQLDDDARSSIVAFLETLEAP